MRLLPSRFSRRRTTFPDTSDVLIVVRDGYHPQDVRVLAGTPVRLRFRREETGHCSDTVLLPELGRFAVLPEGETVALDLGALAPGDYEFSCERGALEGTLHVAASAR